MKRTLMAAASAILIGSLLAGCSDKQGDVGNKNIRQNSVRKDANGNKIRMLDKRFADDQSNEMNRINGRRLNSNNLVGAHQNYRLEMSDDIAARVSQIKGVDSAYVMLTDSNAYVAVTLGNGSNLHAQQIGGISRTNLGHYDEPGRSPVGMHPAGTKGTGYGSMYSGTDGTGIIAHNTTGTGTGARGMGGTNGTGSTVNPNGTTLSGGGGIYGTSNGPGTMGMQSSRTGTRNDRDTTGKGGMMPNHDIHASKSLKQAIADEVMSMAPQLKNVYVSANPEFTQRMTSYALDVRDGQPIQGFIAEFNAMADRIFPAKSGISSRRGGIGLR